MEITEIKQQLTLAQVLHYYHLKPNKQFKSASTHFQINKKALFYQG